MNNNIDFVESNSDVYQFLSSINFENITQKFEIIRGQKVFIPAKLLACINNVMDKNAKTDMLFQSKMKINIQLEINNRSYHYSIPRIEFYEIYLNHLAFYDQCKIQ
jgi:hypothetical protein